MAAADSMWYIVGNDGAGGDNGVSSCRVSSFVVVASWQPVWFCDVARHVLRSQSNRPLSIVELVAFLLSFVAVVISCCFRSSVVLPSLGYSSF